MPLVIHGFNCSFNLDFDNFFIVTFLFMISLILSIRHSNFESIELFELIILYIWNLFRTVEVSVKSLFKLIFE